MQVSRTFRTLTECFPDPRAGCCPVPPQVGQIAGAQVCPSPVQVHVTAGTRPLPLQVGHGPLLLVIVLVVVIASSRAEPAASALPSSRGTSTGALKTRCTKAAVRRITVTGWRPRGQAC